MSFKLEVVVIAVCDVDRAKRFYEEALGFRVDVDRSAATLREGAGIQTSRRSELSHRAADAARVGMLHPHRHGITEMTPGSSQGMHLVSSDLKATRAELVARGVQVSEPFHFGRKDRRPDFIVGGPIITATCRSATQTATAG
jgi:catechol 2,3-dioxygenase-like lactoylglutathione lyase family enzyme